MAVECGHRIARIEHGAIIINIIILVSLILLEDIATTWIFRDAVTWKRRIIVSSWDTIRCCLLLKHLAILVTIEDVILRGIVAIYLIGTTTLKRVILRLSENIAT